MSLLKFNRLIIPLHCKYKAKILFYFKKFRTFKSMFKKILFKLTSSAVLLFFFINVYSCCAFKTDPPDLRLTSQSFPSQVRNGQRFDLRFTVGNFSNTDCDAETTKQGVVNLKMIKDSIVTQVNNTETLNNLEDSQTQEFFFSVLIEGQGVNGLYELIFVIDPNNTTGDAYRENNTFRSTVTVVQ